MGPEGGTPTDHSCVLPGKSCTVVATPASNTCMHQYMRNRD